MKSDNDLTKSIMIYQVTDMWMIACVDISDVSSCLSVCILGKEPSDCRSMFDTVKRQLDAELSVCHPVASV